MALQDVRGLIESVTATALQGAGVTNVIFDNTEETRPDDLPAAIISLSFTRIFLDAIGTCPGGEAITGTVQVSILTSKQTGSKPGEEIATAVLCAWMEQNRTRLSQPIRVCFRAIEGPTTVLFGDVQVPAHTHVLTAGFTAQG